MKILSCKDHKEVVDLLEQLKTTGNVYVNWTTNDVYVGVTEDMREMPIGNLNCLGPDGEGHVDLHPQAKVEGYYYKCPKCNQYGMEHDGFSDAIYGWAEWDKCVFCGHRENDSGGPPQWIIEESRPLRGPGSRAPHGMGIRDEYGGL